MNSFHILLLASIFFFAMLQFFQSSSEISSFKLNLKNFEKNTKVYPSDHYNSDTFSEIVFLSCLKRPKTWKKLFELIFLFFKKDEESNFIELTDIVTKFDRIGFFDDKYRDFSDLFKNYLYFYLDLDQDGLITKNEWDSHLKKQRLFILSFIGNSEDSNLFGNESIAPDALTSEQFLQRSFDETKNDMNRLVKKFRSFVESSDEIKKEFVEMAFEYFDIDQNKEITKNEIISLLSELKKQYRIGLIVSFETIFNATTQTCFQILDSNNNEMIEHEKEVKNLSKENIDKIIEVFFH